MGDENKYIYDDSKIEIDKNGNYVINEDDNYFEYKEKNIEDINYFK